MTSAIEARSLSSLTSLAANPPRYPRNPTHQRLEPLVLYIARVPGSRDVFLTPVKPREKVVSAEDVQSCLYYVHVDQPDDERLLSRDATIDHEGESNAAPVANQGVPRKPLPNKPTSLVPNGLHPNGTGVPHPLPPLPPSPNWTAPYPESDQPPSVQAPMLVARKPIAPPALSERRDVGNQHNVNAGVYSTRHLETQPPSYLRGHSTGNMPSRNENLPPNHYGSSRFHEPRTADAAGHPPSNHAPMPYGQEERSLPTHESYGNRGRGDLGPPPSLPPRTISAPAIERPANPTSLETSRRGVDPGTSLTLIRRDAMAGAQWNVAKITDPPVYEVSSQTMSNMPSKKSKQLGAPLYLEVTNPGYTKFSIDDEARASLDGRPSLDSLPTPSDDSGSPVERTLKKGTFKRRLWMENSRLGEISVGHSKTGSMSSDHSTPRSSSEMRNSSEQFADYPQLGPVPLVNEGRLMVNSTGAEKRRGISRGYVFTSPWNGRCEFSTGSAGRSLKCKHGLPSANNGLGSSTLATVSELRFNLPALSVFTPTPGEDGTKRSSYFTRPRARRDQSKSSVHDHDMFGLARTLERADLSLGQEYAGGGFGGKHAKLGKLIIEDEGLKMMDLLVAANMALWWRAYEKL